jgi:hypothetical protein
MKGIVNPNESCLLQAEDGIRVETYEDTDLQYI